MLGVMCGLREGRVTLECVRAGDGDKHSIQYLLNVAAYQMFCIFSNKYTEASIIISAL